MKLKNKGKVHPSPSPSSSSGDDHLSILKLVPATILLLASVLSVQDREVLAYMITRSLKTTTTPSLISNKRSSKKHPSPPAAAKTGTVSIHKPPVFDCDCFDCYTSYWFRWDSSPNRELIHQVIEAFEDHLTNGESQRTSKKNARRERRVTNAKTSPRVPDNPVIELPGQPEHEVQEPVFADEVISIEKPVEEEFAVVMEMTEEFPVPEEADVEVPTATPTTSSHKGLARKVLPDILGLFNSRLWGLWSPNV